MKTIYVVIICIWSPIIGAIVGGLIGFMIAQYFGFIMGALILCSLPIIILTPNRIEGLLTEVK